MFMRRIKRVVDRDRRTTWVASKPYVTAKIVDEAVSMTPMTLATIVIIMILYVRNTGDTHLATQPAI